MKLSGHVFLQKCITPSDSKTTSFTELRYFLGSKRFIKSSAYAFKTRELCKDDKFSFDSPLTTRDTEIPLYPPPLLRQDCNANEFHFNAIAASCRFVNKHSGDDADESLFFGTKLTNNVTHIVPSYKAVLTLYQPMPLDRPRGTGRVRIRSRINMPGTNVVIHKFHEPLLDNTQIQFKNVSLQDYAFQRHETQFPLDHTASVSFSSDPDTQINFGFKLNSYFSRYPSHDNYFPETVALSGGPSFNIIKQNVSDFREWASILSAVRVDPHKTTADKGELTVDKQDDLKSLLSRLISLPVELKLMILEYMLPPTPEVIPDPMPE